jgi:hypothetical protein
MQKSENAVHHIEKFEEQPISLHNCEKREEDTR